MLPSSQPMYPIRALGLSLLPEASLYTSPTESILVNPTSCGFTLVDVSYLFMFRVVFFFFFMITLCFMSVLCIMSFMATIYVMSILFHVLTLYLF